MADKKKKKAEKHEENQTPQQSSSLSSQELTSSSLSNSQIFTHNQHQATTQIGGKGTVRRRRLRKTHHLTQTSSTSHELQNFVNKFKLVNCGPVDSVTFIKDNGRIQTLNSVELCANLNAGIYQLNVKNKVLNRSSQLVSTTKGNAEDLLNEIKNSKNNTERIEEIQNLIGSDAIEYLKQLVENQRNSITTNLLTPAEVQKLIPTKEKEKSSQILSSNNQSVILNENIEEISIQNNTIESSKTKKKKKKKKIEDDATEKLKSFEIIDESMLLKL